MRENGRAYAGLVKSANILLAGNLFWTERLLLRLVHRLYTHRLQEWTLLAPADMVEEVLLEAIEDKQ